MPWVQTNDIQTYYEVHGAGQAIVFIPGGGTSLRMWKPQRDYFSRHYQIILFDVRGHGQSTGSKRKYSCELYADDLKALLDFLNIDHVVLCGLSLGGMIAQAFATKYPASLQGLVLADTAAASALSLRERVERAFLSKHLIKFLLLIMNQKLYVKFAFLLFQKMKPAVRAFLMQEELQMNKHELIKMMDAVYDFQLLELNRIQVPTLILIGEWEQPSIFYHSQAIRSMIKNSVLSTVPSAEHVSNLENPAVFNRVLENFLGSLK